MFTNGWECVGHVTSPLGHNIYGGVCFDGLNCLVLKGVGEGRVLVNYLSEAWGEKTEM